MISLSQQLIASCFLQLGYSPFDYLYFTQIQKSLEQLNKEPYDKQTLEQLSNQCTTNSKGQIKLQNLIATFLKAENILVQRDFQIKKLIKKLQQDAHQQQNQAESTQQFYKILEELNEAKQQQIQNNINLQIIRKPFQRKIKVMHFQKPQQSVSQNHEQIQHVPVLITGDGFFSIRNTKTFTWIFQLSVLLLIILLPCLYFMPVFLSVNFYLSQTILLLLVVLNMISGYFCRLIFRIWMVLIGITILVDVVWFIAGIKPFWQQTHDSTLRLHSYLRLTVILYGVTTFGKLILFILLASEYNTDQSQKKIISIFGLAQMQLSHDEVRKNIFSVLNKGSNHEYLQEKGFN